MSVFNTYKVLIRTPRKCFVEAEDKVPPPNSAFKKAYIFNVVRYLEAGGAVNKAPSFSKSPRSARQAI